MNNNELDQIIEKSFRTEPNFQLPSDFAQKVMFSVVKREQWKNDLIEYISLSAVILSLIAVVVGLYYYIDKEFVMNVFSLVSGNVVQVVLVLFLLNFILFADRVLLRLLFSRWKND
jgi:hypothetical protein